jgi:hypothetical protein
MRIIMNLLGKIICIVAINLDFAHRLKQKSLIITMFRGLILSPN